MGNELICNHKKKVAVVMATYNGERYIAQQLESIINQTRKPEELIIIDDCSADNTVKIANRVLKKSNIPYRIVVHDVNMGVARSFQNGVEASESDYIMFCDQDDVWSKNKILRTMNCFYNGVGMVVCNAIISDSELRSLGRTMFEFIRLNLKYDNEDKCRLNSDEAIKLLLKRNYATGMCMAVRREYAIDAFPYPETMTYDAWIAWNSALRGDIVFFDEILVKYRQHDRNVIGTARHKEDLRQYFSHRKYDKKLFFEKYGSLRKAFDMASDRNVNECSVEIKEYINEACEFYGWRTMFTDEKGKVRTLIEIFARMMSGKYCKFTSNAWLEMGKDVAEVFFNGVA